MAQRFDLRTFCEHIAANVSRSYFLGVGRYQTSAGGQWHTVRVPQVAHIRTASGQLTNAQLSNENGKLTRIASPPRPRLAIRMPQPGLRRSSSR